MACFICALFIPWFSHCNWYFLWFKPVRIIAAVLKWQNYNRIRLLHDKWNKKEANFNCQLSTCQQSYQHLMISRGQVRTNKFITPRCNRLWDIYFVVYWHFHFYNDQRPFPLSMISCAHFQTFQREALKQIIPGFCVYKYMVGGHLYS